MATRAQECKECVMVLTDMSGFSRKTDKIIDRDMTNSI